MDWSIFRLDRACSCVDLQPVLVNFIVQSTHKPHLLNDVWPAAIHEEALIDFAIETNQQCWWASLRSLIANQRNSINFSRISKDEEFFFFF